MLDSKMMRRNVGILALCQALMMSAMTLIMPTSVLIGATLADERHWATVPLAFMFLGMLIATFPASMLMQRIGRRAGFLIGLMFATVGAGLAAYAIVNREFELFCFSFWLIGTFNGFGHYYRFAAADVASEGYRSRAIAWVMAGGVVAAIVGPNLAKFTREIVPTAPFAASYASLLFFYLVSMVLLRFASIPQPTLEEQRGVPRPLMRIVTQPSFFVAVFSAVVAYGSMNFLMTATPLAMADCGFGFDDTVLVIQWHVLGMFAPAFVTGHLIKRFGVTIIMAIGGLILLACGVINLSGVTLSHFLTGLFLLGVGWNFLFIGATTLVTEAYRPPEKAKTQGFNDVLVFGTVTITALSSGYLHEYYGWQLLNIALLPFVVLAIIAIVWLHRSRLSTPAVAIS